MYDKQIIINYIKNNAYKIYIDKKIIQKEFNCSEKTCERILKSINYKHMNNNLINIMKDIEIGLSIQECSVKYSCSESNIKAFIKRHNINKVYNHRFNNYMDPYYFSKIDSHNKAYILGFIAADGYVGKTIKIGLHSKDKEILEKIIKEIGIKNINIKDKLIFSPFNKKLTPISILSFGIKEMIFNLNNLGFYKNKTISFEFPNIEKQYYLDFIRGYVDGDGSFTRDKNNRYSFTLEGTKEFLLIIKKFFEDSYNIKFNTDLYKRFNTDNCCYTLRASGKNNVIKLLDLLYKDSELYLERKYNKYLEITKL